MVAALLVAHSSCGLTMAPAFSPLAPHTYAIRRLSLLQPPRRASALDLSSNGTEAALNLGGSFLLRAAAAAQESFLAQTKNVLQDVPLPILPRALPLPALPRAQIDSTAVRGWVRSRFVSLSKLTSVMMRAVHENAFIRLQAVHENAFFRHVRAQLSRESADTEDRLDVIDRSAATSSPSTGPAPAPYRIDSPGARPRGHTWWFGEFQWKTAPLPTLDDLKTACFVIAEGSERNLLLCTSPMGNDWVKNEEYSSWYGHSVYICLQ